jgi:hypothetical protein
MKLKQISVPIENSNSRLYEFTRALGDKGIYPRALTLVDTGHFGELRVLVSDTAGTRQILMQKDLPGRVDDVVAVQLDEKSEELTDFLATLMEADIKVKYSYALARMSQGRTIMIFQFSDNDRAIKVLGDKEIRLVDRETIGQLEAAC